MVKTVVAADDDIAVAQFMLTERTVKVAFYTDSGIVYIHPAETHCAECVRSALLTVARRIHIVYIVVPALRRSVFIKINKHFCEVAFLNKRIVEECYDIN